MKFPQTGIGDCAISSSPSTDPWRSAVPLVQLLAGRWTLALLGELSLGGRRYQELRDVLDGISHKVLTETLRRAERAGLILRQLDHDRIETATLYQLTELGHSLELPLSAFGKWAALNWPTVDMAQRQWDSRSDGTSPSP